MPRRALVLMVSGVLVLVLGLAAALVPVPYVALVPGPTSDTLGTSRGKPIIEIIGRRTYPTDGHLNFTTVAYRGGPGDRIDLFTALRGWVDPRVAVVPEETIFPRNESVKEVERQNTAQMRSSQEVATAAALRALDIPVTTSVQVQSTQQGMPAHGKLRPGDRIVRVDGAEVEDVGKVAAAVSAHKPGEVVTFTITRGQGSPQQGQDGQDGQDGQKGQDQDGGKGDDGGAPEKGAQEAKEEEVEIKTVASKDKPGKAAVGVLMQERFVLPFTVKISVGDVGGPSAGLMFALAIYDKLTPGSLTGGAFVAGTGSITPEGRVGPIGGIQQKMLGASKAGATVFLTPKENCPDAVAARPPGLRLVKVGSLDEALAALGALRTGKGPLPSCENHPKAG